MTGEREREREKEETAHKDKAKIALQRKPTAAAALSSHDDVVNFAIRSSS